MEQLKEFIYICNKMYIKQLKNILKILENSNLQNSCSNNLCASGELIINILQLMEKEKINVALPCLRNAYEMTLKAIVLEDNKEIYESYNKIFKKVDKDGMDKVRRYIGNNINRYFSIVERENIFENILEEGILTYIYKTLCRYAHATKVNEFVYLAQKNNNIKDILNYCLITFLIYPIILMYIDAVCTKLSLEELQNETCIIYTIITFNLINILLKNENKIEEIKNFSEKIIGEPDKLFRIRTEKERELIIYYTKESTELLENGNIQKSELNKFLEYYLKKYFTKKQLEKLNEIIKIYNKEIIDYGGK